MMLSVEQIFQRMKKNLGKIMPEMELRYKAELAYEINELKQEKNAVILGHNYMEPALYFTIPDFRGDSLELARQAATTNKEVIVFCGVRFMAETAKILSPDKTVLLPSKKAGCSLADSITAHDVRELKREFPGVPVVTYVNTYADVKAESDVCCTSGNAAEVVNSLESDKVIFLPDQYFAANVARETGKDIIYPKHFPEIQTSNVTNLKYQMIGWKGKCEVHEEFSIEDIENTRKQFPDVIILAHPECKPEVCAAADFSGSTSAMVRYVQNTKVPHYLLLTECSMSDNIAASNPDKDMLRLCSVRCPHMNEITLEETRNALKNMQYNIEVPEETRIKAYRAVQKMIEIG
jgi:quinolinate synthase